MYRSRKVECCGDSSVNSSHADQHLLNTWEDSKDSSSRRRSSTLPFASVMYQVVNRSFSASSSPITSDTPFDACGLLKTWMTKLLNGFGVGTASSAGTFHSSAKLSSHSKSSTHTPLGSKLGRGRRRQAALLAISQA